MVHRRLSDGDLNYDRDRLGCPGGREPRARSHAHGHVDHLGGRKRVLPYDHRGSGARDIRVGAPVPVHGQPLRLGRLGQRQGKSEGECCCGAHGMAPSFLGSVGSPTSFR